MPIVNATDATWRDEIDKRRPALLYVWATWCGPCRQLGPAIQKLAEESPDFHVIKVEADTNPGVMTALGALSVPQLIMYCRGEFCELITPNNYSLPALRRILNNHLTEDH